MRRYVSVHDRFPCSFHGLTFSRNSHPTDPITFIVMSKTGILQSFNKQANERPDSLPEGRDTGAHLPVLPGAYQQNEQGEGDQGGQGNREKQALAVLQQINNTQAAQAVLNKVQSDRPVGPQFRPDMPYTHAASWFEVVPAGGDPRRQFSGAGFSPETVWGTGKANVSIKPNAYFHPWVGEKELRFADNGFDPKRPLEQQNTDIPLTWQKQIQANVYSALPNAYRGGNQSMLSLVQNDGLPFDLT